MFRRGRDRERRTLPTFGALDPQFYADIAQDLGRHGVSETPDAVAESVGNAIANTAHRYFSGVGDVAAANRFDAAFAPDSRDSSSPDAMIDWLLEYDRTTEEFLTTLVGRLRTVLATPA